MSADRVGAARDHRVDLEVAVPVAFEDDLAVTAREGCPASPTVATSTLADSAAAATIASLLK